MFTLRSKQIKNIYTINCNSIHLKRGWRFLRKSKHFFLARSRSENVIQFQMHLLKIVGGVETDDIFGDWKN